MSDGKGVRKYFKEYEGVICISSSGVQEVLGIHRNTLMSYRKRGLKVRQSGWYAIIDLIEFVKEKDGAASTGEGESFAQMKLRYEAELKKQQTEKIKLKNEIDKGEYIRKDEVILELSRHFVALRRSIEALARSVTLEISHYVGPDEARKIEANIKDVCLDALGKLAIRGVYDGK